MRTSKWHIATLKEIPNDAEIVSHQLMLRAGMIRKLGSGLYTWLPLGLKVLRRIEQIVREEMNRSGALEILMPAIQPAELWQETGRWDSFGNQLLTMKDSNNRAYCFGPTHEEVVTDLMRQELQSYKQLPVLLYQIQTKFRDEIRPRFGVMRAREFIMKDAYSFHLNEASLQITYDIMYRTYCAIFNKLGLQFRAVEADTGAIGGAVSHEFQVLADAGEDLIFYSDTGTYAANSEQATALPPTLDANTSPSPHMLKTLLVIGRSVPVVALILRADDNLNPIKAAKHPAIQSPLTVINDENIQQQSDTPIIIDHHAQALSPDITHEVFDLRLVKEGDRSPDGIGTLRVCRGIEVGHIFQLGDKYAQAMHAAVLDESGKLKTMLMGCYGLGISRIVAAAIEQHHDEKGICWPESIAPFQVVIIPINAKQNLKVKEATEALYQACLDAHIDVLLEDRAERPGVLFATHDLIGIPHRVVISERHIENNQVEYKARTAQAPILVPITEVLNRFV